MARLRSILEPGEQVLAQNPEAFVIWCMRVCAAGLTAAIAWSALDGTAMLTLL